MAIIYLALAVFRLGFLCNLLSRPIISAFLTAGAMTISLSQVHLHCHHRDALLPYLLHPRHLNCPKSHVERYRAAQVVIFHAHGYWGKCMGRPLSACLLCWVHCIAIA